MPELPNEELAERFLELAQLLEQQGSNPYRAGAYGNAAQTLQQELGDEGKRACTYGDISKPSGSAVGQV